MNRTGLYPSDRKAPLAELLLQHAQMPHRFFVVRVSLPNRRTGDHVGDRRQAFATSLIGLGLEVIFYSLDVNRVHFKSLLRSTNRANFYRGPREPTCLKFAPQAAYRAALDPMVPLFGVKRARQSHVWQILRELPQPFYAHDLATVRSPRRLVDDVARWTHRVPALSTFL